MQLVLIQRNEEAAADECSLVTHATEGETRGLFSQHFTVSPLQFINPHPYSTAIDSTLFCVFFFFLVHLSLALFFSFFSPSPPAFSFRKMTILLFPLQRRRAIRSPSPPPPPTFFVFTRVHRSTPNPAARCCCHLPSLLPFIFLSGAFIHTAFPRPRAHRLLQRRRRPL